MNVAIVFARTETIQATAEWAWDEIASLSEQGLWLRLAANWFCQSNELMPPALLGWWECRMCNALRVRSELRRTDSASALSSWTARVVMRRRVWRCCCQRHEAEST